MNNSRNHGTGPDRQTPRLANGPDTGRNDSRQDRETDTLARIANYKNRAAELREISETLKTPVGRQAVLQVALEYEQMAAALEKRTHH